MALNYFIIGKLIRNYRKQRKLSQAKLAELSETSVSYLSYIETGRKSVSLDKLVRIANALKVTADMLLGDNLDIVLTVNTVEVEELLAGCTAYERRVILESMKQMKKTMIELRGLLKRGQNR